MSIVGNQHPEPHHRLYPWNLFWPDSTSVFSLCAIWVLIVKDAARFMTHFIFNISVQMKEIIWLGDWHAHWIHYQLLTTIDKPGHLIIRLSFRFVWKNENKYWDGNAVYTTILTFSSMESLAGRLPCRMSLLLKCCNQVGLSWWRSTERGGQWTFIAMSIVKQTDRVGFILEA